MSKKVKKERKGRISSSIGASLWLFWVPVTMATTTKVPRKLHSHISLPMLRSVNNNKFVWGGGLLRFPFNFPPDDCQLFIFVFLFIHFSLFLTSVEEMPIASGATGRVDVGVDTNKRWAPGGRKRNAFPVTRHHDSYLLRWNVCFSWGFRIFFTQKQQNCSPNRNKDCL